MPVVAFTTLWLAASAPAASAPAVPATESSEPMLAPAATGRPPDGHNKPKPGQSSATSTKKTGSGNDEPGCEE